MRTARAIILAAAAALPSARAAHAADTAPVADTQTSTESGEPGVGAWFANWFNRVDDALASEPAWAAPIVMATPRVVELFRFDTEQARVRRNVELDNYGLGRGLSLVPNETTQISLGIPAWETRIGGKQPGSGFGDLPIITLKERLYSRNAQQGNEIVTLFLGAGIPTGSQLYTQNAYTITPAIYAGKGWGRFDIQGSLGVNFPVSGETNIGTSMLGNLVFQYHLRKIFWPEVELNYTHWFSGIRQGLNQTFMTLGLIVGRFDVYERLKITVGAGYQFALTPAFVTTPAVTPIYNHAWLTTFRLAF